jgi:hypothetical protein
MTLLPVLLTVALWRQAGTALKVYLVGTLVLLAAVLALRSGLSGLERYEYRGLLQRVFTLSVFPPIGVAAYTLGSRIGRRPVTGAELPRQIADRGPV